MEEVHEIPNHEKLRVALVISEPLGLRAGGDFVIRSFRSSSANDQVRFQSRHDS